MASVITAVGAAKLAAAQASGIPLVLAEFAVGDGATLPNVPAPITPAAGMTALVHEVWRGAVNAVTLDPSSPNIIRVEGLIPAVDGGFTIYEAGVFDADGDLIIIANYPRTEKPNPASGASIEEYVRILVQYSHVSAVSLTADLSVIMATREDAENDSETVSANMLVLWERFT